MILSSEDEANIYEEFISSLEQPLQGMITSEENRLDFCTVAARVQQLERSYHIERNPFFGTPAVNAVVEPESSQKMIATMMDR